MPSHSSILIATRGSALALAQANLVLAQCRQAFPNLDFQIKIIKTTGDKLQTASLANPDAASTKGLFTKELEIALLKHKASLAVHSLKDLPTDLPEGLHLGAVCQRADARDVFIFRDAEFFSTPQHPVQSQAGSPSPITAIKRGFAPGLTLRDLPLNATVATSSTRRQAQLLALRSDLKTVPIRGNVGTRLHKLSAQPEIDALILAAAGLQRLGFQILPDGKLLSPPNKDIPSPGGEGQGEGDSQFPALPRSTHSSPDLWPLASGLLPPEGEGRVRAIPGKRPHGEGLESHNPEAETPSADARWHGLRATVLDTDTMLPCVGQAAIGIESRVDDEQIAPICEALNHPPTHHCVRAERAFLHAMGGGCQSPVGACAIIKGKEIFLRAVSFRSGHAKHAEASRPIEQASALGAEVAAILLKLDQP